MTTLTILIITLLLAGLILYFFRYRFSKPQASQSESGKADLKVSPNFFCPDANCFVSIAYDTSTNKNDKVELCLVNESGQEKVLSTEAKFEERYKSDSELFTSGVTKVVVKINDKVMVSQPLQLLKPGLNTIRHESHVYMDRDQAHDRQFATDHIIFAEVSSGKAEEYTFCTHAAVLEGISYKNLDKETPDRQLRLKMRRKSERMINLGDMKVGDRKELDPVRIDQGIEIEATLFSSEAFPHKSTARWVMEFEIKCLHETNT